MTLLILGLLLWIVAHLFKRVLPDARAAMTAKMGEASKGVFAVVLLASVVLMVIGFRAAPFVEIYEPPSWARHLNNLAMLIAVVGFGVGHSKSRLRAKLRHPMLLGMLIWAVAHLLVNGDRASVLMFGVLGLWAIAEIVVINRAQPVWERWTGGSVAGDVRLAVITVVIFAIITWVHTWLGYYPFPG